MQNDFNEHGEEWFKFEVIHRDIPESQLHLYEISEIAAAEWNNESRVYNISKTPRISSKSRKAMAQRARERLALLLERKPNGI